MVITSKLRRHKVMERAMRALMGNNLPPRFKFKDTYDSIEVPTTHQQHLPSQATLEAKFDELIAEEETEAPTTEIKADMVVSSNLEVGTSNLFVDTETGNVGIGTTNPAYTLDVHGTSNVGALTATSVSGSGSGLTSLNASNLASGTVPSARLSLAASDIPNLSATKITSGTLTRPISTTTGTFSGDVGIGTTSPIARLDINGGAENNTTPALSIRGGLYDPSDLYVLNTYNVNTGVGYAAKVIGVNIKNKVETDNTVQIRNNVGGVTSAGAIYLGSDDLNQGIFGVLGGTGTVGSTLAEYLTVKGNGNVGIGTASPSSSLHVNLGNASGEQHIRATQTSLASSTAGIRFGDSTWDAFIDHSHGSKDLMNFGFYRNPTRQVNMVLSHEGNVGIGTTSPNGNLHIMSDLANASSQINPSAQLVLHSSLAGLDDDGDIGASLVFTQRWLDSSPNSHGTMGSIHGFKDLSAGNYGGGLLFKTQPGSDTAPVERMRIDRDGNVGIGLTSPVYTLDVNGVSRSRGVCVNSGFGNGTARPALTTGSTHPSYEIRSIGGNGNVGSAGGDDGFLRLRAGGGTGTNSASYIDLSGYSTYSGGDMKRNIVFGTLGTERMRIKENGNVGIGTTSPGYKLDVNGTIYASGDVIMFSDERKKTHIEAIPNALEKVLQLRGVTFNKLDDDNRRHSGVIAQEVEKVLPEVVYTAEDDTKSVAYGNMIGLLIEAIKELAEK